MCTRIDSVFSSSSPVLSLSRLQCKAASSCVDDTMYTVYYVLTYVIGVIMYYSVLIIVMGILGILVQDWV